MTGHRTRTAFDMEAAIPEEMRETSTWFEALGGQIYHETLPDEA